MHTSLTIAIKQFLKTTTLHGFKYLGAPKIFDRIGWLLSCCASACCAGMLCTILWARYLQVPALLTIQSQANEEQSMPLIAVCGPAEHTANILIKDISREQHKNDSKILIETLTEVIAGDISEMAHLRKLEFFLEQQNANLSELLMHYAPDCNDLILKCRWFSNFIPCDTLFQKRFTRWGICCVLPVSEAKKNSNSVFLSSNKLTLAINCPMDFGNQKCFFVTKFKGAKWVYPQILKTKHNYWAQLTFNTEIHTQVSKIDASCVPNKDYSQRLCLLDCAQKTCGCHDPFVTLTNHDHLKECSITKMNCLRSSINEDPSCSCLPPCRKIQSVTSLENNEISVSSMSLDPIFVDLNISSTVILQIRVLYQASKLFKANPTETWLTLLSSLGGVFNMFLGVGLFSALEVLFLIIVRLPIAFRTSPEMQMKARY